MCRIRNRCFLVLSLVLLFFSGCAGGGSSGTGGFRTFQGFLVSEAGDPLSGVEVMLEGTADSDITDENGEFLIETETYTEEVVLQFEGEDFSAELAIEEIPQEADTVDMELLFDEGAETVEADEVEFFEDGTAVEDSPAPQDDSPSEDDKGNGNQGGSNGDDEPEEDVLPPDIGDEVPGSDDGGAADEDPTDPADGGEEPAPIDDGGTPVDGGEEPSGSGDTA